MAETAPTRRAALETLILSLLGAAGLVRFLTPLPGAGEEADGTVSVADADVPAQGVLVLPERGCAIVRDGRGLRAVDLTCTHLGCIVAATPAGFACPCHGSRFEATGAVTRGPAGRPLRLLEVSRRGDRIEVRRPSRP